MSSSTDRMAGRKTGKIAVSIGLGAAAFSGLASASDFTPLMVLLLIPFAIVALIVWALTWPTTAGLKIWWLRIMIRSFGICLIFTPTHTVGGNGRMLSVALYDMVGSAIGADPIYAKQALVNALVATAVVSAVFIAGTIVQKRREGDGPDGRGPESSAGGQDKDGG